MLMLSQCVTFGMVSKPWFDRWAMKIPVTQDSVNKNPATVSDCDWRETADMIDFQAFVASIKVEDDLPQVTAKNVPLSVILSAHHNLVTYGVAFVNDDGVWTNPGPKKTFYIPTEAMELLAGALDAMNGNSELQTWLQQTWLQDEQVKLQAIADVPGMRKWVELAREQKWDVPKTMREKKAWKDFHELAQFDER